MTEIVQLADIHFGAQNEVAIQAAFESIMALEPDGIIVCGDLTQRGKKNEFEAAAAWLDKFAVPKLIVPGNHDTPLLNMPARAIAPFERFNSYFAEASAPIQIGGWRANGLNTARGWQARTNWAEGSVDLRELSVATQKIGQAGSILACHHPFLPPENTPLKLTTARGKQASDQLARSPVTILLTGHIHAPSASVQRTADGHYLALTAGTLSARTRSSPPSFNTISLRDDRIEASVFHLVDDAFRLSTLGTWRQKTLEPMTSPFVD